MSLCKDHMFSYSQRPAYFKRQAAKERFSTCKRQRVIPMAVEDTTLVAGIDLGTTNSCIAVTRGKDITVTPPSKGILTLPSVVAYLADGTILVGAAAKRQAKRDPENVFYSVKRFIGRTMSDIKQEKTRVAYSVKAGADKNVLLSCKYVENGMLAPEEVSARILQTLLSAAEGANGVRISKAVISVPAYFNDNQRDATIAAGRMAGLENVKLIKEPIAAALAYGVDIQEDQTVMVLDLGGGTFDVSILEVGGGSVEVISTGGDAKLGGDDWDNAIIDWLASRFLGDTGFSWRDPAVMGNLRAVAEMAKVKLSSEKQVALTLPLGRGGEPIIAKLTRVELDKLTAPLYRRLQLPVDACCWQAGFSLTDALKEREANQGRSKAKQRGSAGALQPLNRAPITKILLIGGATRMPSFQKFAQNMTGIKPDPLLTDPDLAVARGAAVYAASLSEGSSHMNQMETMEPLKKALMEAIAKQKLREDETLGRRIMGEEYEAFSRQSEKEEEEWTELEDLEIVDDGNSDDEDL